jgi:hypothetical protein
MEHGRNKINKKLRKKEESAKIHNGKKENIEKKDLSKEEKKNNKKERKKERKK